MLDSSKVTTSRPTIIGSLLVGADAEIAEMVRQQMLYVTSFGKCSAFGVVRNQKLIAGVVFNHYHKFDVQMSAAFFGGPLPPSALRALCEYAFGQLNVRRVTSITGKKNRKARKALRIIGFIEEGTARYALDGVQDAVQYGLLRENCKWISKDGLEA